jgi:hypothetical protein
VTAYAVTSLAVFVLTTLGAIAQCCGVEATDLRDLYREERKMYKEKILEIETELIKKEKELILLRGKSADKIAESRIAINSCG